MTLGGFLRWWLRGLRATAVNLDEFVTQRRLHARLDAEWEREAAEWEARIARVRDLVDRLAPPQPVSLEALWQRPSVEPDRSGYARPALEGVHDVTTWMVYERSAAWWGVPGAKVRDAAAYWLAMRERVTGVRLP